MDSMEKPTMVSDVTEDRRACELDVQRAETAHAEGRELDAWKRFGTLSFEDYVGWAQDQSTLYPIG